MMKSGEKDMTNREMKEAVCGWAKQSYEEKLFAGTSGNLSVYHRGRRVMAITPTSVAYEGMTAEDVVVMSLDGEVLEGGRPSSEWRMHAAVYKEKPEIGAVIHTHSPYATAFAVNHRSIPVVLIEMVLFFGGDIPLAQFAIPGTWEVGEEAVKVLKERTACLLANHGVLTVGEDLKQAHLRAVYVEDAAKICSIAMTQGTPVTIAEEFVAAMKEQK